MTSSNSYPLTSDIEQGPLAGPSGSSSTPPTSDPAPPAGPTSESQTLTFKFVLVDSPLKDSTLEQVIAYSVNSYTVEPYGTLNLEAFWLSEHLRARPYLRSHKDFIE